MPIRFKAAILYETNRPLRVEDGIEVPALAPGQVLVRLAYAGVCHSQIMEVRGGRGVDRYLPHMLGHEGTGIVMETGPGVEKVAAGQKIILGWVKGGGADVQGASYRRDGEIINAGAVTTFNEYAVVSENRCTLLPEGIPMDVGVLFGCALPVGAGIVINTLKPVAGSSVAVFGLGGVGMSALMACMLFDCAQIIAVDVSPEKLAFAQRLGATVAIDARTQDPVAEVRRLTNGAGVDYSVESAGMTQTIEQAFNSVRRSGGLCVFASHPRGGEHISLDPFELICGKRILGSWGGESHPDRDTARFAELYLTGRLPLENMITKRYALDDINLALDDLEQRRCLRPLIEINPSLS
jgi:S-(hydroxymethyl)glutathione dehydrogenase/alcohol dehydrogenase